MNTPQSLGLKYLHDSVMSNFDHEIDAGEWRERPRTEKVYGQYSGWNFCGYVWWDREAETFKCEVWQYHSPQEIVSGTPQEIMDAVCEKWGDL
jgi:hypothetical protein